jgi:NAD(P)-dependent dehydrogenase (short-subunit alcohol dehydrogenase family)
METKIAIVTGANGGMGKVITEEISRNGFEVIMACRDLQKSEPVYREIVQKTGGKIVLMHLDLSSLESVNQFITEIKTRYKSIHLLIHNAGVMDKKGVNSSFSVEQTFSVNYLAPYILTRALVPIMPIGSRIVSVSSLMYKYGKISPSLFESVVPGKFSRFKSYSNSKLALLLMGIDLSDTYLKKGITINTCEPGIVNTPILKMGNRFVDFLAQVLFRPFVRTPEKGAETIVYLALHEDLANKSGGFYSNKKEVQLKKRYIREQDRLLLRKLSEQFIESQKIVL